MRRVVFNMAVISLLLSTQVFGAVVWEDTFDGPSIDTSIWAFEVGNGTDGWGNWELQYYTDRIDGDSGANAYIENGNLVIEARRENYGGKQFTSARLITKNALTYKYGTLEARIKMANLADGLWPAFWLLGTNIDQVGWPACGELDIMEMGSSGAISGGTVNRKVTAAAHWEVGGGQGDHALSTYTATAAYNDYHLFKLIWTPSSMTAYLDGTAFWWFDITDGATADLEEYHEHMFILLNMAVGGSYTNIYNPDDISAPFPAKMYIDWIRLTDNAWTEYYNVNDTGDNPETGYFGVFTETTPVNGSITFDTDAFLYLWNNLSWTSTATYEGNEAWSFNAGSGAWFGAGVYCSVLRDMRNYTDGQLRFHMKTTSSNNIGIGIKSSDGAEQWIPLINGGQEYGLVRDGAWHEVAIPLSLYSTIDFTKIEQIFMFNNGGQIPSSSVNVSFDNIYWAPAKRSIQFAGHNWEVKSGYNGPGPNYFSDSENNVWVDENGDLHLKITNQGGQWDCAEIISEESFGYGTYVYTVDSRVDLLDQNIVLGLFTWDTYAPEYNYREIDFEFSRWKNPANDIGQYVIQPWEPEENMFRFDIDYAGQSNATTHVMTWRPNPDGIYFKSYYGSFSLAPPPEDMIIDWHYTAADNPPAGGENARMNLWLIDGLAPSNGQESEIVISDFQFLSGISDQPADINDDKSVDLGDFSEVTAGWQNTDCEASNTWCGEADLTCSGFVDIDDILALLDYWMASLD